MRVDERKVNEWYARAHGYFWLPCPVCGEKFGGHEWEQVDGKPSAIYNDPENPGKGRGICPACTAAGKGNEPNWQAMK